MIRVSCHGQTRFVRFVSEPGVRLHEFLTKEIERMANSPYKVKGLAERVLAAKNAISTARGAVSLVEEQATKLATGALDIAKQFNDAHDDMQFEATALGNSSGASNILSDLTKDEDKNKSEEKKP